MANIPLCVTHGTHKAAVLIKDDINFHPVLYKIHDVGFRIFHPAHLYRIRINLIKIPGQGSIVDYFTEQI